MFINSVDLENLFRQINTDSLNVHDGRSAQVVGIHRLTVAQEKGGDHSINKADDTVKVNNGILHLENNYLLLSTIFLNLKLCQ